MVRAISAGYVGVTPYLIARGASRALEFYRKAFGASGLGHVWTIATHIGDVSAEEMERRMAAMARG